MLKYIFPILIFILLADKNISNNDLVEFDNKYYLANSYNPYSGKHTYEKKNSKLEYNPYSGTYSWSK